MKIFKDPGSAPEQLFLLPPSVNDYIGPAHPARVIGEVLDRVDCRALYARYQGGGAPAYDPRLMLKALVFAYLVGMRSSRQIAEAFGHDLRLMYLSSMSHPDHNTICRFRRAHEGFLAEVLLDTIAIARQMSLVTLEHVAVDGTKVQANTSGKRTYSAERLERELAATRAEVSQILQEAEAADIADEERDKRPGPPPSEKLKDKQQRQSLLEKALEELRKHNLRSIAATDPESRVMRTTDGPRSSYNAQAVVDAKAGIIVAADVTQDASDNAQFGPMLAQAQQNVGATPAAVTADGGYWSAATLEQVEEQELNAYIAASGTTPRQVLARRGWTYDAERDRFTNEQGQELTYRGTRILRGLQYRVYRQSGARRKELMIRTDERRMAAMRAKVSSPEGRVVYRLRQQVVEPVFGHIKEVQRLRRFLLRGLAGARIEWLLSCIAHNLGKIAPAWSQMRAADAP